MDNVLCHRLHTSDGRKAWRWVDGPPNEQAQDDARNFGWELELAYSAEYVAALQAEVARLTAAEQESFQKFVDTNEQRIELLADARQLAASVRGAFGALGSDPPEPILKLANRYFLMKRRGRRSAALNGGQDDA